MPGETHTMSLVDETAAGIAPTAHAPQLVLVLRADHPLLPCARFSLGGVEEAELGRSPSDDVSRRRDGGTLRIDIPDRGLSQRHVALAVQGGSVRLKDLGSKNGTRVNDERVTAELTLADGDVVEVGHTFLVFRAAASTWSEHEVAPRSFGSDALTTFDATLAEAYRTALDLAPHASGILVQGPSGTGKELVARAVHARTERGGSFVGVSCGALAQAELERQLFGHVDGDLGLIRAADRGTLFLDEVLDLPLESQSTLLRVLQEREVLPVGATEPVPVDFKLVSAAREDMQAAVDAGRFRSDLMARLSGVRIDLPTVQERKQDIGLMLQAILRRASDHPEDLRLSRRATRALLAYAWPLNIREMEQAVALGIARAEGQAIAAEHLPAHVTGGPPAPPPPPSSDVLSFFDCELDREAHELRRGGEVVAMEPQVFQVLRFLAEQRHRVVTKEELLAEVWGDRFVSESALTSRLKAARQAVGDDGRSQRVIKTLHRVGYRFVAPLTS
ncbi:MAG: sigma 54-interacting transcriptional regulator [Deltaproteobacteria bacterium]